MSPDYKSEGIEEILVRSTLDGSEEPALFRKASAPGPRPLLVDLHTWSCDRHAEVRSVLPLAKRQDWHLLIPEYRGPNLAENPRVRQACASRLAMQDILDAVDHVVARVPVDAQNIFLHGASGGGHMAMMMAGYAPRRWRSVAAVVGISDLEAWYQENPDYAANIAACCGGAPSDATRAEYRARSPIAHAREIAQAELTLYHGKFDKSVPFTHSVRMFEEINRVAPASRVFLNIIDAGHDSQIESVEQQFLACLNKDGPVRHQANR